MAPALGLPLWICLALGTLGLTTTDAAADEPDLDALVKPAPRCDPARKYCLGLRLHIAVTADGAVATADWISRQLEYANHHFAAIDLGLQITGVAALPADAARIEDARERTALAPGLTPGVIDVFVTAQLDDIDVKDSIIYGVTWPAPTKKYIIISTMAWERTLAHELGHVFGLPHSGYAISIMNKRERKDPPLEQRTFHPNELTVMRWQLQQLLRSKIVAHIPPPKPAAPAAGAPAAGAPAATR